MSLRINASFGRLWCKFSRWSAYSRRPCFRSSREYGIPECRRSLIFEAKTTEGELSFVNTTEQFHSGNGDCSRGEALEPEHGAGSGLDAAMILFDQIIQILRRAQPCASW